MPTSLDADYIPSLTDRLELYQRFAAASGEADIARLLEEAADRFNQPPPSLLNLADATRLKLSLRRLRIRKLVLDGDKATLFVDADAAVTADRLVSLCTGEAGGRFTVALAHPNRITIDMSNAAYTDNPLALLSQFLKELSGESNPLA